MKDISPKNQPVKHTDNSKYARERDREMVKGIFRFHEAPGAPMSFVFKKYKDDPVERFDMQDGCVYTIPLGVAKHLNQNGWYPEYGFIPGEPDLKGAFGGGVGMKVAHKVRRFSFQSLEFIDDPELNTVGGGGLLEVQPIGM